MSITPRDLEQTSIASANWLPGYELLGMVGKGGHGEVFKARQLALDRVVAVKLVDLHRAGTVDPAARFEREAVALGRFHHPNIVPVFDYGRHNDRLYMAMELLEGEDLGSRVRRTGPLAERTAWLIIRQAAAGLAHAAAHGVIHRDVKPANLFLVEAPLGVELPADVPMVKVTDFGLAQAKWDTVPTDEQHTAPGVIVGTPAYMAPEQHRGSDVDLRADIYALGASAYHAIQGHAPFAGRNVWEIMARKLENTPAPFTGMSSESAALIHKMMAPEPNARVQSYAEVIAWIDQLLDKGFRLIKPKRRALRIPWGQLATATGVALALVIGIMMSRGPRADANNTPVVRYASTGEIESLFDGASLDHWASSGVWAVAKDDEGVSTLSGTGTIRRVFTTLDNYQVTIGLDIHDASAAEIQFAIPAEQRNGRRCVLRISREIGGFIRHARRRRRAAQSSWRTGWVSAGDLVRRSPAVPRGASGASRRSVDRLVPWRACWANRGRWQCQIA